MSRGKVSSEEKLIVAKACAEGRISQSEAARRIEVNRSNVREWTALYNEKGAAAFEKADSNPEYSAEIKLQSVKVRFSCIIRMPRAREAPVGFP